MPPREFRFKIEAFPFFKNIIATFESHNPFLEFKIQMISVPKVLYCPIRNLPVQKKTNSRSSPRLCSGFATGFHLNYFLDTWYYPKFFRECNDIASLFRIRNHYLLLSIEEM